MYLYLFCRSIGYEQIRPYSLVRDVTCETVNHNTWRHLYAQLTDELSLTFTFVANGQLTN